MIYYPLLFFLLVTAAWGDWMPRDWGGMAGGSAGEERTGCPVSHDESGKHCETLAK